jgi:hypothetical protein
MVWGLKAILIAGCQMKDMISKNQSSGLKPGRQCYDATPGLKARVNKE